MNELEQTAIPGTDEIPEMLKPKRTRQTVLQKAVVGDLVVALSPGSNLIAAIEAVDEEKDAEAIVDRWKDQGVTEKYSTIEVWEFRVGGYYRKRSSK